MAAAAAAAAESGRNKDAHREQGLRIEKSADRGRGDDDSPTAMGMEKQDSGKENKDCGEVKEEEEIREKEIREDGGNGEDVMW